MENTQDATATEGCAPAAGYAERVEMLEKRLRQYRELVKRLAVARDKNEAWYVSKSWCPFWRELAFDLPSENEQQAMLFK